MQFHTLTNAIFSIEKMAGSEGQPQQLFVQLHKLSKQVNALTKRHQSIVLENSQSQKEKQQLKKRLRKTTAKLEKKEEECQQLQNELVRTKDVYDHKISKLIRSCEERPDFVNQGEQRVMKEKNSKKYKSRDVQCQILNESLVKELQERNICLLKKINQLEKELEEQKNENNSKQLYIDSMLTALDSEAQSEPQSDEDEQEGHSRQATCQDIFDVSTIDADSLKDEEPQPEYFPEGEKRVWQGNETQRLEKPEGLYSSMENAFKRVKSWIWKV